MSSMKCHHNHFWRALVLVLGLSLGASATVWAHKARDAYLEFVDTAAEKTADKVTAVKFSIALRDLDAAIDTLDSNNDRSLVWGEIRQNLPVILAWVGDGIRIDCNRRVMDLTWAFDSLEERPDGVYIRLRASISCPSTGAVAVDENSGFNTQVVGRRHLAGASARNGGITTNQPQHHDSTGQQ